MFLVSCTVDDSNYFFNLREKFKYCESVELLLKGENGNVCDVERAQKVLPLERDVCDHSGAKRTEVKSRYSKREGSSLRLVQYVALQTYKKIYLHNLCLHRQREMHMYYVDSNTT